MIAMASLLLSEFTAKQRDSLYFDRYEYCIHFVLPELNAVRSKKHETIDIRIDHRVKYARWAKEQEWGTDWHRTDANKIILTEDKIRKDCHNFLDFINTLKDHKLVISISHGYIYTNSLEDAYKLTELDYITAVRLSRAIVTHPRGTLKLARSNYNIRSYFRSHLMTDEQKDVLKSYLNAQSDIRLSPALARWLRFGTNWCKASFFIDYNTESDLTMLGLFLSRPFRKTLPIVKVDK